MGQEFLAHLKKHKRDCGHGPHTAAVTLDRKKVKSCKYYAVMRQDQISGISAVGSAGGLGAIFRLSTMGTAKARNPLRHSRLRDFYEQQNRGKKRV